MEEHSLLRKTRASGYTPTNKPILGFDDLDLEVGEEDFDKYAAEHLQDLLQCPTATEETLFTFRRHIKQIVAEYRASLENPRAEALIEQIVVTKILENCIFVGHVKTDLDSIAGALGAAHLFGGIPAKSEEDLNGEILFALQFAGISPPEHFDRIPGGGHPDESGNFKKVCLVDHNEAKQMTPLLRDDPKRKDRIVGLIDHHAVSETFCTERALLIDVRPWGSMSSIVAHTYIRANIAMPKHIARILLCAILSDTLNLRSVTTTKADRLMVGLLTVLGEVGSHWDVDELATKQFRAKTDWIVNLGPYEMVNGDQKDFTANGWKFGIAVLEVTDPEPVMKVAADLLLELRILKKEKGNGERRKELDFAFLFVVDVTNQCSKLLICGGRELALAQEAFPGAEIFCCNDSPDFEAPGRTLNKNQTCMNVGNLVSRKSQFAPAIFKALMGGFQCHKNPMGEIDDDDEAEQKKLVTVEINEHNSVQLVRNLSASRQSIFFDDEDDRRLQIDEFLSNKFTRTNTVC